MISIKNNKYKPLAKDMITDVFNNLYEEIHSSDECISKIKNNCHHCELYHLCKDVNYVLPYLNVKF